MATTSRTGSGTATNKCRARPDRCSPSRGTKMEERVNEVFEGSTPRGLPSRMNTTAPPILESSSPATGASADYTVVIRPSKGFSKLDFAALWEFRELFYFLVWRDVKIRYK